MGLKIKWAALESGAAWRDDTHGMAVGDNRVSIQRRPAAGSVDAPTSIWKPEAGAGPATAL